METKSDTIKDTVIVYIHQDAQSLSDSALVEEVLHRYDRVYQDITSHDTTHGVVTVLVLVALVLSILNRRRKNKQSNG
jgi:hypothetical protein